jgi:hypothetical protein
MSSVAIQDRIKKAATPLLEPGEVIEVATVAAVGKVSVKRQIATAAITAILTAGTVTAVAYSKKRPTVLTNRRLLFLDANELTGRPQEKLVGTIGREGLRAQRQRGLLWLKYDLIDNTGAAVVRLSFPVPARKAGNQIAQALGLLGTA